jgi:hypothetical protein
MTVADFDAVTYHVSNPTEVRHFHTGRLNIFRAPLVLPIIER